MADATKISALTSAGGLDGTEYVPLVKDGVTVKATPSQFAELVTVPSLYKTATTDSTTSRSATNDDAWKYIRFTNTLAKQYTFSATAALTAGLEWTVKNASTNSILTFVEDGVTINRLDGKAIIVPIGGTVQVRVVSALIIDIWGDLQDSEI